MGTVSLTVDQAPVAVATNEELAGPAPVMPEPVKRTERVSSVDTLRGFALMGILVMNITSFGMSAGNYIFPLSTMRPVFHGPHWLINTACWFGRMIFAEGKMRALFSMLFGAGVILLTQRAEARGAGSRVADIFTRRNMWLTVFGLLHAYLIWEGDILFFYGVAALLFLFPFRNVRAKRLLWVGAIVLTLNTVVANGGQAMQVLMTQKKAAAARVAYAKNHVVTKEQREAIDAGDKQQGNFRKSDKKTKEDIAAEQKSYWSAQAHDAKDVFQGQTKGAYVGFGDWFAMMLLGMGLYKNGFLSGKLQTKTYAWTAAIALGVAWPVIFAGCMIAFRSHFDMVTCMLALFMPYDLGRVGGALGNAALVMLVLRAGWMPWLMKRVAAVGQMALSNYLLTSLSMRMLFVWGPLKWYGYMEYYKLYLVVLCMWAVNLTWSLIWLRHFQFGPMEWVWRSLTYWKRQPMRVRAEAPSGAPDLQPAVAG